MSQDQTFFAFEAYNFEGDQNFQAGLPTIIEQGRVTSEIELTSLVTKAKCYYYSRVVEPVDYNDYMSWKRDNLRESTLNIRETLNKDLFTNSLEKNIRIHNGVSGLIECGNDSSPQYPSSFQEICAMIASGKPIPVKHIPNLINTLAPKKAQFKPRPKPWETKNESS